MLWPARVINNAERAEAAMFDLDIAIKADDVDAALVAAQALESAACQMRRALKASVTA